MSNEKEHYYNLIQNFSMKEQYTNVQFLI